MNSEKIGDKLANCTYLLGLGICVGIQFGWAYGGMLVFGLPLIINLILIRKEEVK